MSTMIAECYVNELENWTELISFYRNQITLLKKRLFQVTKSRSFLKDGAKIENFQVLIIQFYDLFYEVESDIKEQVFKLDTTYVFDDFVLNESIENNQQLLRYKIYIIEKNYLTLRYLLYNYLMQSVKKVSLGRKELNLIRI